MSRRASTVREVIGLANHLIFHRASWCKHGADMAHARDSGGRAVDPTSRRAVRYTLVGALAAAAATPRLYLDAYKAVQAHATDTMLLAQWQDRAGWEACREVLAAALLDAIDAERVTEEPTPCG